MAPSRPPPSGRALRPLLVAAGAALALAVAFGVGRWTSSPPPEATPRAADPALAERREASAPPQEARAEPRPPNLVPAADGSGPAPAARPPAQRMPIAPDVLARLRAELSASLEERRQEDLARCWPRSGLPNGQPSLTVTYDLTFDPWGREIARGLSDDRRAPAGGLGHCLVQNPGAPLAIRPQGTYVSLRVQVTYP